MKNLPARFAMISSMAIPFLVYLTNSGSQYPLVNVYLVLSCAQRIIGKGSAFSIMKSMNGKVFNDALFYFLIGILVIAEMFDLIGLAYGIHSLRMICLVLRYIFLTFPLIGMFFWMQNMYYKCYNFSCYKPCLDWFIDLSNEDYGTFILYGITLASIFAYALLPLCGDPGIFFVEDFNKAYVIAYSGITAMVALLCSVVPDRIQIYISHKVTAELAQRRIFVSHIAHEMRTPLSNVSIGLELLKASLPSENEHRTESGNILREVQYSTAAATQILTGILDYEKLGCGAMTVELASVHPLPFLKRVISPFNIQAKVKEVEINFDSSNYADVNNRHWTVSIDEVKMAQVIRNFVSNALKFSPKGSKIEIVAKIVNPTSNPCFRVEVKDCGPGISEENLRKVFNSIVQFDANKLQGGGGSGIGLWVTKKIVDLHDGRVYVESKLGYGSTFILELKASKAPLMVNVHASYASNLAQLGQFQDNNIEDLSRESTVKEDIARCASSRFQLHCLVVDDSALNRRMVLRLLTMRGYTAVEAADGLDAYNLVTRTMQDGLAQFDVVLIDNHMPVMNGHDATQKLRDAGYRGLIIGITGDSALPEVAAFMNRGADGVLVKPIRSDDLMDIIQTRHGIA